MCVCIYLVCLPLISHSPQRPGHCLPHTFMLRFAFPFPACMSLFSYSSLYPSIRRVPTFFLSFFCFHSLVLVLFYLHSIVFFILHGPLSRFHCKPVVSISVYLSVPSVHLVFLLVSRTSSISASTATPNRCKKKPSMLPMIWLDGHRANRKRAIRTDTHPSLGIGQSSFLSPFIFVFVPEITPLTSVAPFSVLMPIRMSISQET